MSTEIRFYHLLRQPVEQALPSLLHKALETGKKIIIHTPDPKMAEFLNEYLWTYDPNSFLPHGTQKDKNEDKHPVYITHNNDNPNNAKILILVGGANRTEKGEFDLCCEMFDGNNQEALGTARQKWKAYKEAGDMPLTYWQQTNNGWEKKA